MLSRSRKTRSNIIAMTSLLLTCACTTTNSANPAAQDPTAVESATSSTIVHSQHSLAPPSIAAQAPKLLHEIYCNNQEYFDYLHGKNGVSQYNPQDPGFADTEAFSGSTVSQSSTVADTATGSAIRHANCYSAQEQGYSAPQAIDRIESQSPQAVEQKDNAATNELPIVTNKYVEKWMDNYTSRGREGFIKKFIKGHEHKEITMEIFAAEGVPKELYYLALVESGFNNHARSRKKATGMWQFMKGTARHYGLRIDSTIDERRDPTKATFAAARYLKDLHSEFGDWYLAIAAYNAGPGKIHRAIRRTGSRDFWQLVNTRFLSRETKSYVPKILAAIIIAGNHAHYGIALNLPQGRFPHAAVKIFRPTHLPDLAKRLNIAYTQLKQWNPAIKKDYVPGDMTSPVFLRLADYLVPQYYKLEQPL